MIKVLFSKTRIDGPLFFDIEGHADYRNAETGNNDVCVSISAIGTMLVRHMYEEYGIEPTVCVDGHLQFNIKESSIRIGEVFTAVMHGISGISEMYPGNIKLY